MKIAICLHALQPRDGTGNFAMQLGDLLAAEGHAVTMLATRQHEFDPQQRHPNLAFLSIGQGRWQSTAALVQQIGRLFQAERFQVVFICAGMPVPVMEQALCLLPDETAVVPILLGDREHVYAPTTRSAASWNVVATISPRLQQVIQARLPHKPVRLLPTGIPLPSAAELATRLPFTTPVRLLFVGRQVGGKNVHLLPLILASCRQRGLDARLTMCGNGHDHDALVQACQAAGLAHLVDFPDVPDQPALYALYRQHHILLWPSSAGEGLGLVLLEAQANGCVPVATRMPGVSDFSLCVNETGLLAEERNVEAFVDQLVTLCDPVRWQEFSQAGLVRTRQLFALVTQQQAYRALLDELSQGRYPLPAARATLPRPCLSYRDYLLPALQPLLKPLSKVKKRLFRTAPPAAERANRPTPAMKQQRLREAGRRYNLRVLVETGTCFGDTIAALQHDFDTIYSMELSEALVHQAQARFATAHHITVRHGDSGQELAQVLAKLQQPALFWLDAHYSGGGLRGKVTARGDKDTPICEELQQILTGPAYRHVIMIDDAHCFGADPAYPTIAELQAFVQTNRPGCQFVVQDNMIQITL